MDEADVTQKARAFVAKVDVSGIREDLIRNLQQFQSALDR